MCNCLLGENETMEKTRPLLVPQYMNEFKCIGSTCEDSCCFGWRVEIDKHTYKKYKKCQHKELKPLFDNNIKRIKSNSTSASFAKIIMQDGGGCSFLSDENLCKIQLNLGEEALSNTCAIYPRSLNKINGIVEKSLTMSCPEAAKLALLNPNGIEFEQTEEPSKSSGFILKHLETTNPNLANKPSKYFWELRFFTIQVLQDRIYSLNERLILLGLFFQKVQEAVDNGNVHSIPNIIASYTSEISNGRAKSSFSNIPTQLSIQMKLCKELLDFRIGYGITSERYMKCISDTLHGLQYTNEATIEEITKRYKESFEMYFKPFSIKHGYILENYLVNNVFKNLFPFGNDSMFDDYVMLIVHYSLIKLHLIGMSGFHKGLSIDLAITLIQSFSKTVEHNNVYLKNIFNILQDNEYTSMAYMAILINN